MPHRPDEEAPDFAAAGSHRSPASFHVHTGADGAISHIRIGRWRVLTASPERRLAEVRRVGGDRVAVRILRLADGQAAPSSEIWQLYDIDGRLDAALQTTPDGKFAMLTNYRTRQACRLAANEQGTLQAVETWRI
ncbi:MAG TPA: hypothetical protein VEQ85_04605 [Lacipirellulaceae bacterium]|nr:hypothetical protein [Lacipirellulaceae bacterium]